jgi:lysophospholipase L1-like esterase
VCPVPGRLLAAAVSLVVLTGSAGATAPQAPEAAPKRPPIRYHVALGDSLAAGTQPGRLFTREGYADQLAALRRRRTPRLRLVKLACPGETSTALRRGGRCPYPRGSQLAQAAAFLRANRGRIAFVTIDIGANDYLQCAARDLSCAVATLDSVRTNLPPALRTLRRAAGKRVPIVGMDYYAPFLSRWTDGGAGELEARTHAGFVASGNALLRTLYQRSGARVARVERAFATHDFTTLETLPGGETAPRNVARVCRLTWMCSHRDIHPNAEGHGVIARAFADALR